MQGETSRGKQNHETESVILNNTDSKEVGERGRKFCYKDEVSS